MDLEFFNVPVILMGVPSGTRAAEVRDAGSIPGSGRSPGGGHGNPLNPMDRETWRATVHRVAKCWT